MEINYCHTCREKSEEELTQISIKIENKESIIKMLCKECIDWLL